jgi:hypothetical protein
MKYRVKVIREITHETTVEVEADSPAAAFREAEVEAVNKCFEVKYPTEYRAISLVEVEA